MERAIPASIIIETMERRSQGYQEAEHTADWELHVWARTLPALFEQAARGMYALSGIRLDDGPGSQAVVHKLHLEALDHETLLVAFLSELLLIGEQYNLGFAGYNLEVADLRIDGTLTGGKIVQQDKEIKAVTFHNLRIREEDGRLTVNIVFDV